jgi:hypothetical protein
LKDEILAAPDILAEVAMLCAWRKSLWSGREKKQQDAAIPEGSGLPARLVSAFGRRLAASDSTPRSGLFGGLWDFAVSPISAASQPFLRRAVSYIETCNRNVPILSNLALMAAFQKSRSET